MYVFALIAIGAGLLWLALERPAGGVVQFAARFGALSYGVFAILTGLFWVCSPSSTAALVPGNSGGALVVTATQARGVLGIVFGLIAIGGRKLVPASWRSVLLGPLLYNLVMSAEAFAAQFTVLATLERWLYVTLHFLWAASFGLRFLDGDGPVQNGAGSVEAPARNPARIALLLFAALAVPAGIALFAIPYDLMAHSMPGAASAFFAHAVHGLGSASIAIGAVAFSACAQPDPAAVRLGVLSMLVATLGIAILALTRATELGALQAPVRVVAVLCVLCAATLCVDWRAWRWRS